MREFVDIKRPAVRHDANVVRLWGPAPVPPPQYRSRKRTVTSPPPTPARRKRGGVRRIARGVFRSFLAVQKQGVAAALALVMLVAQASLFVAFEAFVVNVTAEIYMIDAPVITPPGGNYVGPQNITIDDADADATYVYYTITPGLDPDIAPDPVCGAGLGGLKPQGPIAITDDSVVKAIACDALGHGSLITTEIYDLTLTGIIEGHKYHDLDESGTLTGGDTPIEGWELTLRSATGTIVGTAMTNVNGYYSFMDMNAGSYTVVEEERDGWDNITPTSTAIALAMGETEVVEFFNFDTGFECLPIPVSFPANLAVQAAGATASSSNDDIVMHSNTDIFGNARSNDEIEASGGGVTRIIHGNATVVNTVSAGVNVTGTIITGAAAASLPNISIPTWIDRAQDGGTVNGTYSFPNGTGLTLGPIEITGNVTFGSSNTVLVKGPIYIRGNLTIGSNSTITQDPAFGDQFSAIIVDGEINIASNINFVGAGTTGTFLLVSTRAAISGDNAAIETDSNNSDLGDVVLYASNGDVHINSNRTLLAIFAAHGTGSDSDDNGAIRLESNVDVRYRTLPTTISCGPRQPFETTSHVLINEFMPNVAGSLSNDTGSAGLPHDGEWVELFNPTASPVDVTGWVLYDNTATNALPITAANTIGSLTIPSLGYLVVYRDGDSDFAMNNTTGDSVRLFTGLIGSGGVLVDSHTYTISPPDEKSFARIPDGSTNWVDPDATPGETNAVGFFAPSGAPVFTPPDLPLMEIELSLEGKELDDITSVPQMEPGDGESEDATLAEGETDETTEGEVLGDATTADELTSATSTPTHSTSSGQASTEPIDPDATSQGGGGGPSVLDNAPPAVPDPVDATSTSITDEASDPADATSTPPTDETSDPANATSMPTDASGDATTPPAEEETEEPTDVPDTVTPEAPPPEPAPAEPPPAPASESTPEPAPSAEPAPTA